MDGDAVRLQFVPRFHLVAVVELEAHSSVRPYHHVTAEEISSDPKGWGLRPAVVDGDDPRGDGINDLFHQVPILLGGLEGIIYHFLPAESFRDQNRSHLLTLDAIPCGGVPQIEYRFCLFQFMIAEERKGSNNDVNKCDQVQK